MRPLRTENTTNQLNGTGVGDLPICATHDSSGNEVIVSVWELSDDDLITINTTGKITMTFQGHTHPPVYLLAGNIFDQS